MSKSQPFWKTKRLEDMNRAEWESLCDGCGRCCLHKLRDDTTDALEFTEVACHLLDLHTCRCQDYAHRKIRVPDCVSQSTARTPWAVRLTQSGTRILRWHPLVSGDPDTVHTAGI